MLSETPPAAPRLKGLEMALNLFLTDLRGDTRWRWALLDEHGNFLADHEVNLEPGDPLYRGFQDLHAHLRHHRPTRTTEEILSELGAWMGRHLFGGPSSGTRPDGAGPDGGLADALLEAVEAPATAVHVHVPAEAQALLFRPLELAHLDGRSLVERGVRFVYQGAPGSRVATSGRPIRPDDPGRGQKAKPMPGALRVLAVFSLPDQASPLDLRQERHALQQRIKRLQQALGRAIELRILQYGATRETLKEALRDGGGWDVIHYSGHGLEGELVLEKPDGTPDRIRAEELLPLLTPTSRRLKLLILSACYSGAASLASARAAVGLEPLRTREHGGPGGKDAPAPETSAEAGEAEQGRLTEAPSLAQRLSQALDCATLAMRYPVGDRFAMDLVLELFDHLMDRGQPLPGALHLALDDALAPDRPGAPALSRFTPILFGPRAAELTLVPPRGQVDLQPVPRGVANFFPPPPERFVGRVLPMLRASRSLAGDSAARGVLFHGMAGAGKTACALELAWRHERDRFTGHAWYRAPDLGQAVRGELARFLEVLETQLDLRDHPLLAYVNDPAEFERRTLPVLRGLLRGHSVLIVMDNLEGLLTESGGWREPLWGPLMDTLVGHDGLSRVVMTSRVVPEALRAAALRGRGGVRLEPIHALSFGESVLLARALPHLGALSRGDEAERLLLRGVLEVVQGHPKLIELADGLAADRARLEAHLAKAGVGLASATATGGAQVAAFFETGESVQDEAGFVATLARWTGSIVAELPPASRLLLAFLSRLEAPDRASDIVEANWTDFLNRLKGSSGDGMPGGAAVEAAAGVGLEAALEPLIGAGLVAVTAEEGADGETVKRYGLHPAVAETVREGAAAGVLEALDQELGDFWVAQVRHGLENEMQGRGPLVVTGGKRGAPYLVRARRWEEASTVLEYVIHRDWNPGTLALVLPFLQEIATATRGTDRGLENEGNLANALLMAGQIAEAETLLREQLAACEASGDFRLASALAGQLLNLFMSTGRLEEALALVTHKADWTRRAGLGPWTQLVDEGMRLQILNALGRYDEVLDAVQRLRPQLDTLPEQGTGDEAVRAWNVRETLLDTGRQAAAYSNQWQTALSLNAEIVQSTQRRGAEAVELARTRFNDYFPLLRLGRPSEARTLLDGCRAAFEAVHDIPMLGKVFSAQAGLENEEGAPQAAARFGHVALRYGYQAADPEDCAISHHNLAHYLERSGAPAEQVLAHRLAAASLRHQMASGQLNSTLTTLARRPLPPALPSFAEVVATVEQVPGVQFRALFERLPRRGADGDAALAAVWAQVMRLRQQREANMAQMLQSFDPLLQGIAAVANGVETPRAQIEALFPQLEQRGWQLTQAVQRLWAGERDLEALTAGIDPNSALLVRRIVELIAAG